MQVDGLQCGYLGKVRNRLVRSQEVVRADEGLERAAGEAAEVGELVVADVESVEGREVREIGQGTDAVLLYKPAQRVPRLCDRCCSVDSYSVVRTGGQARARW